MALKAVAEGTDDASRERAYARPVTALAPAYAEHLGIAKPVTLRVKLIQVLAQLKHRDAVPKLIGFLRSENDKVRLAAIRFFQAVPDLRAFQALGALVADRTCGAEARAAVKRLYVDRVITPFNPAAAGTSQAISALGEAIEERRRREEAILGSLAPKSAPPDPVLATIARLRSSRPEVRMQAAWELGESKDPRAREPLFKTLLDADGGVARMAAAALGDLGAGEHRDAIVEQLRHERPVVRRNAAYLLGRIGDTAVRPALEAAYKEEKEKEVRYALEDALVTLRE
jgi:HEAT repeat protein